MKKQIIKMKKDTNGITLIALIITIIVLLILAGISIASLTGENGILSKAKEAKDKTTEAEVKEKIGLLLAEYQLEKIYDNPKLGLFEYFEKKQTEGEIDRVEDNQDGTIDVSLDGYTVTIDVETLTIIDIEISNDIKFSYELISYQDNKFQILIKVEEKTNGLVSIEYPDGTISSCNGEKLVEINYEVDEGVDYVFTAKNSNGVEKREVVNFIKPANPSSPAVNLNYPTLTLTGVESPKIEINYDEREQFINYYSIDNGETWSLYTGPIAATGSVIKAKSVHKKCQDIFGESEITVTRPDDSIAENAFDGDLTTAHYASRTNYSFNVDESTWGQFLSFTYYFESFGNGSQMGVNFYDSNEELKYNKPLTAESTTNYISHTEIIEIPNGTHKIQLYSAYAERPLYLYEVGINCPKAPKIYYTEYDETKTTKAVTDYPILTLNGVMNCSINPELGTKIKFEVANENRSGIENYYSLDGGKNWNLYTNPIETTYQGEGLIQAKSTNKYYKSESNVSTLKNYIKDLNFTCTASNAIGKEAYDGDEETFSQGNMVIDDSAQGIKVNLKYISNGTRTINFFNSGGGLIGYTSNGEYGIKSISMRVTLGSISMNVGGWDGGNLYEITVDPLWKPDVYEQ